MASTTTGLMARSSMSSCAVRINQAPHGLKPSFPRYTALKRCNVRPSTHGLFTRQFCSQTDTTASATGEEHQKAIELLSAASDGKVTAGGDIIRAMRLLEKEKIKYESKELEKLIGGDASPGRAWRLVFVADEKPYQAVTKGERDQGGYMFPLTAVQCWDATTSSITNSAILGFIAALKFSGSYQLKGRALKFTFEKCRIKLGPAKFTFDVKEQSGTFAIFYVDDEILVARGQSGGTALWQRPSPSWLAERGVLDAA